MIVNCSKPSNNPLKKKGYTGSYACILDKNYSKYQTQKLFYSMQVFNCFGRQFCLHFEAFHLGMAPVYMAFLRFMGDENEARKFSYSLEVGGYGRKLIWQGVPRSIRDSHKMVRDSQDGLIIQRKLALFFSGGERQQLKLKVAGRIWKEQWGLSAGRRHFFCFIISWWGC